MKNPVWKNSSLWLLGLSPLVWAAHFLFTYILASVWCAKFAGRNGELASVRTGIFAATVIALSIVGVEIFIGWKKNRHGHERSLQDRSTPGDRERFLGKARFLISSLSFIAIVYTAYVAWFFRSCL